MYTSVQASYFNIMTSVHFSSGLVHQRKERCTIQCTLSSKEEESSYLWPFSSTSSCSFRAYLVFKWIGAHLGVYPYSLIQPKIDVDWHTQFLRWGGERVNKQHVLKNRQVELLTGDGIHIH
jgi:hypothetical protein